MSKNKPRPPPAFTITFADAGDATTTDVRLKRLIKSALRTFEFRCSTITTTELELKMKIGTAFPGKYIKSGDLPDPRIVTIDSVELETMQNDGEEKLVVSFEEIDQNLVLNKTNAEAIAEIVGDDDTDNWPGKQVELFATKTEFRGKRVDCVRVREATETPWE